MNVLFGLSLCASNRVGLIHLTLATMLSVFSAHDELVCCQQKEAVTGAWCLANSFKPLNLVTHYATLFSLLCLENFYP